MGSAPVPDIPDEVRRFRAQHRAASIGPRYSGWAHLAFTSLGSIAVIAIALHEAGRPAPAAWLTVPVAFLFANLAEYLGHRGPMHRPRRGLGILFERHTRQHHQFFTHDAMAFETPRDFQMVLFPPAMLFFFLGVVATPIALALFLVASRAVAWLFVATAMAYFLTYESLHFAYHLGERSKIGGLPFVARLRRHHQAHHDKALMGRWNFNITFPIADALFGTRFQGHEREPSLTRKARRP